MCARVGAGVHVDGWMVCAVRCASALAEGGNAALCGVLLPHAESHARGARRA